MEVSHLHVCLNPSISPDVFRQRVMLYASSVHPIVKQLLTDAVLRVKGWNLFDVLDFWKQLHHVIVVPIRNLEHLDRKSVV